MCIGKSNMCIDLEIDDTALFEENDEQVEEAEESEDKND